MRRRVILLVVLAGVVAVAAPAFPFLARYGTVPHKADGPVTLLLAGVTPKYDESAPVWPWPARPEDYSGLTDTILLAQLRPDGTTNMLSIPRDTWVNVPGNGWGKINGSNPHGGPETLVGAVQNLTGVKVDAYALLSLNAMRAMTQAAGGVTLDVAQDMKYDDNAGKLHIDLKAGRQHLSGEQAEGYLRFRKDNLGDIGRVARQQNFLGALLNKIKSPLNWWRMPGMVGAVDRNMKSNLTRAQVAGILGAALSGPKVAMHTVPGNFGGGGTWVADRAALATVVENNFTDPNDPRRLSIAVINTAAPSGSARRLQEKLEGLGYLRVSVANGPQGNATTTITGPQAGRILQDVGHGQVVQAQGVPGADVTVRLGSDTPAN
ncbi:LCP family protein [Deinococcus sp. AJ005]|uniref:LCP family protein n=1 Tax=Deinococcus sp. AJ005 TaxID=2652443 RepID=UPI00125CCC49|nr:LCP family protein [Deinococcus sp. AJ005]QFP76637.1 LytR family transcriptional regulator [Deinococcus sp. AJ005]